MIVTWVRSFTNVELPLIVYAGLFPMWIVFYVLGVAFSFERPTNNLGLLVTIALFALIMQFFEAYYLENVGGLGFGIKTTSFLFSVLLIIICFDKKMERIINTSNWLVRRIIRIGEKSFTIYLTHYLVIFLLLNRIAHPQIWYIDWLMVLVLDIFFVFALNRLTPLRFHKILGL